MPSWSWKTPFLRACYRSRLCRKLTAQGSQGLSPLVLVRGLAGAEVDPERPEAGRATRLRRTAEDVRAPGNRKIDKTGGHDRGLELCVQQSPGNSASPEIDLAFG